MTYFQEERCVMCGEIVPEGRMVCPCCEQNGDTDAIALIRRHFEGYIASKCLVTYDDGDGRSYTFPDDELRYLAEAALYAAIFGFKCKEPPPDFII